MATSTITTLQRDLNRVEARLAFVREHLEFLDAHSAEAVSEFAWSDPRSTSVDIDGWSWTGTTLEFTISGAHVPTEQDQTARNEAIKSLAAALRREFGGRWVKEEDGSQLRFEREFEGVGKVVISFPRSAVCRRVVKDVKITPRTYQPSFKIQATFADPTIEGGVTEILTVPHGIGVRGVDAWLQENYSDRGAATWVEVEIREEVEYECGSVLS